jgi:hypothetical protein
MLVDDAPARVYRMSAELNDDPAQVTYLRDYFEDVLDQIYPADRNDGYGYAAGPHGGQEADGDAPGRRARHGRHRPGSVNRAGAAALTAVAVVGTGVSAGVFGIVPFLSPAASAPHVMVRAAAPDSLARALSGHAAPVRHHAEYTGKHRKPAPAGPAAWSPSAVAPAQAAPASPAGAHAAGAPAAGGPPPAPAASQQPASPPRTGGGTGTSTGAGHHGAGHGLVGGLEGGATGLLNGLTSSL